MQLVKFSVRRPVLISMVILALSGMGLFCYTQLNSELFPKVDMPIVTVITTYPGAGPDEIEQLISREIEDEVSTIEGIKHINSVSSQGASFVVIEFYLEIDIDVAAADVRAKVDIVRDRLPEDADDPIVEKFNFTEAPVMELAMSAPRTLKEVYFWADEKVKNRLSNVPGVASVDIVGGQEREIHIITDQQRLRSSNVSMLDVVSAVKQANLELPGGFIRQDTKEYNVRVKGKFTSLDEIANMKVGLHSGRAVYLRDIAEIKDHYKDIRTMARADGQACVGISIQKRSDGNVVKVDHGVREKLKELETYLPADFEITVQNDQAPMVTSSIDNVFSNIVSAIIMTAIALFIFLHSMRSSVVISFSMPVSVLTTFIIMYLCGFTLNMLSLMGVAMTVGVLVNNSIFVLENIVRYLHMGHDPKMAADEGSSEIAVAVMASTLTNVVVFVPIAFMGGIVGQFFKDFGLAATFATLVSLFVSFTLAPMMSGRLLNYENTSSEGPGIAKAFGRWFDRQFESLKETYANLLGWFLKNRVLVILLTIVAFVFSSKVPIGFEFFTQMDQGRFVVLVEMPTGTLLSETDKAVAKIEESLRDEQELPELVQLYSTIGYTAGGSFGGSNENMNTGQINVKIKDRVERTRSTKQVMADLRTYLARVNVPGARIKLLESEGGGGTDVAVQLDLLGDDIDHLRKFGNEVFEAVNDPQRCPGAIDVDTNYRMGQPEIKIVPDRIKCRSYNIEPAYVAQSVMGNFEGLLAGEYRDGSFEYDIRVRGDYGSRDKIADVADYIIPLPAGGMVRLPDVAQIEYTTGPSQLFRRDRQGQVSITCDVAPGTTQGELAEIIEQQVKIIKLKYPDCSYAFSGEVEMMKESNQRMGIALVIAICLTFMLVASLLESIGQAVIIMFALPLSMIGVFLGLYLTGQTFSIFSIMSVIMLVGLVVNNSIVVLDHSNHLQKEKGMDCDQSLIESGRTRLRPILMANITTIIALIPLALGWGWGGEMRQSMAVVQIGGLITGGMLGLLVVPSIYSLTSDWFHFFSGNKKKEIKELI